MRRSRLLAMGGYDGDVLFENLELIRTVRADGGRIAAPLDLYVRRRRPRPRTSGASGCGRRTTTSRCRCGWRCWLAVVPLLATAFARRRRVGLALGSVGLGAARRAGTTTRRRPPAFPATSSLLAPVWVLERGVCAWLALLQRGCGTAVSATATR